MTDDLEYDWYKGPAGIPEPAIYFNQRAAAAYCEMFGRMHDVDVRTGSGSFATDGTTVFIPPITCLNKDQLEYAAGAVNHEIAHVVLHRTQEMKDDLPKLASVIPSDELSAADQKWIYNLAADVRDELVFCGSHDSFGRSRLLLGRTIEWMRNQYMATINAGTGTQALEWKDVLFLHRLLVDRNTSLLLLQAQEPWAARQATSPLESLYHTVTDTMNRDVLGRTCLETAVTLCRAVMAAKQETQSETKPEGQPQPPTNDQTSGDAEPDNGSSPQNGDAEPTDGSQSQNSDSTPDDSNNGQPSGTESSPSSEPAAKPETDENSIRRKLLESLCDQLPPSGNVRSATKQEAREMAVGLDGGGLERSIARVTFNETLARETYRRLRLVVARMAETDRADGVQSGYRSGPVLTTPSALRTDGRVFGRREAEGELANVVLLLDVSGSTAKDGLLNDLSAVCYGFWKALTSVSNVKAYVFHDNVTELSDPRELRNVISMNATATDLALDKAYRHLSGVTRGRRVCVLITDGKPNCRSDSIRETRRLLSAGISVIAVGVGRHTEGIKESVPGAHVLNCDTAVQLAYELSAVTRSIARRS